MKKIFLPVLIFFAVLFADAKPSHSLNIPIPGVYVPGQSKTEFKICQIRRIFCGNLAVAIIAISIFVLGVMLLNNKLHWSTAMIVIIGISVFYYAEDLVKLFGRANAWNINGNSTFILNPTCSCSCNPTLDWLNPSNWFNGSITCPVN